AAAELLRGPRRERVGEVRADHVEAAVREVDDAENAEDQRQPARDQEQQQPVLRGVQALDEEDGEVHGSSAQSSARFARTILCAGASSAAVSEAALRRRRGQRQKGLTS